MRIFFFAAALLGLLVGGYAAWSLTRTYPTPARVAGGYEPQLGDLVFQSTRHAELSRLVEGATRSPFSHCGIVALDRGRWVVIEAVGPVRETPLEPWIRKGRGGTLHAFRLGADDRALAPAIVAAARRYLGRPYDWRFRLDDERIYCSELVYKAFRDASGRSLAAPVPLHTLDWQPFEDLIRKYEGGPPPLDREIITPRDVAASTLLTQVFPRR